jgi:hypothetical protein
VQLTSCSRPVLIHTFFRKHFPVMRPLTKTSTKMQYASTASNGFLIYRKRKSRPRSRIELDGRFVEIEMKTFRSNATFHYLNPQRQQPVHRLRGFPSKQKTSKRAILDPGTTLLPRFALAYLGWHVCVASLQLSLTERSILLATWSLSASAIFVALQ